MYELLFTNTRIPVSKRAKWKKVFEANAQQNTPSAYRILWYYGPNKKETTIVAITPYP